MCSCLLFLFRTSAADKSSSSGEQKQFSGLRRFWNSHLHSYKKHNFGVKCAERMNSQFIHQGMCVQNVGMQIHHIYQHLMQNHLLSVVATGRRIRILKGTDLNRNKMLTKIWNVQNLWNKSVATQFTGVITAEVKFSKSLTCKGLVSPIHKQTHQIIHKQSELSWKCDVQKHWKQYKSSCEPSHTSCSHHDQHWIKPDHYAKI